MKNTSIWLAVILAAAIFGIYAYFPAVNEEGQADNVEPISQNPTWEELVARHPAELSDQVNQIVYSCDESKSFLAKIEMVPGTRAEVFLKDGTKMLLARTMSGSGIRYANSGESFIFWAKGDTAFIEEGSIQSYSNCVRK